MRLRSSRPAASPVARRAARARALANERCDVCRLHGEGRCCSIAPTSRPPASPSPSPSPSSARRLGRRGRSGVDQRRESGGGVGAFAGSRRPQPRRRRVEVGATGVAARQLNGNEAMRARRRASRTTTAQQPRRVRQCDGGRSGSVWVEAGQRCERRARRVRGRASAGRCAWRARRREPCRRGRRAIVDAMAGSPACSAAHAASPCLQPS